MTVPLRYFREALFNPTTSTFRYHIAQLPQPVVGRFFDSFMNTIGSEGEINSSAVLLEAIPVLYQSQSLPSTFIYYVTLNSLFGNIIDISNSARVQFIYNYASEVELP